jgi:[CysO sulfur-carrier protein]-S-L-cysteine hydrolase
MTGASYDTRRQNGAHRLLISSDHLSEMVEHVRAWFPMEGCGLLAANGDRVTRVYPGTNVANSRTFYEMDPRQVLDAMREIDKRNERLAAIFHSHPSTESWPSPTDLDLIFDPNVFMIIISLAGDEPDVRAFRYEDEIQEVPIILTDSPDEGAAA